ncbi:globin domain-containing protein [Lentzea sp. BCCO 10_0856]|uniref:nitric oxide dioxygenase n=1 Tax=Lentzea miocenica TaxID=3095431 RepID=A0ABU4T718_9PSEU|nr:globin domain-containing protein [Lentzea sp. BCCO 10_0856]MDX8033910.1 globin domain-containing protein [Lentzea sp. BCCO 10_0856]
MLSPKSAELVEATLPAVGAAVGEISQLFYRRLFAEHPVLLRVLFNRGNQANGTQAEALAGSIAVFASGLLAGQQPDAMLRRVAHKHVSVGVTAGQYAVVHKHLLAAVAEVLNVTPEIAAAWSEVYWLMADTLIGLERFLPRGQQDYRVIVRFQETEDVVTFVVRPVHGPVPLSKPGQYVSVQVPLPDGARQIRQYSLSGRTDDALQFSVKRDGEVSRYLHDFAPVGSTLRLSRPAGDVTLEPGDGPVLFASAGIGCTPMISMLAELAATDSPRRVIAVHGDRDQLTHPFRAELAQLAAKLENAQAHVFYERPIGDWPAERTGLVDLKGVSVPENATAYLCGPVPFLRAVRAQLLEAGVTDIHYEVFGPDVVSAG